MYICLSCESEFEEPVMEVFCPRCGADTLENQED